MAYMSHVRRGRQHRDQHKHKPTYAHNLKKGLEGRKYINSCGRIYEVYRYTSCVRLVIVK